MKPRLRLLRPFTLAIALLALAVSHAVAQSGVQFVLNSAKSSGSANAAIMTYLGDPVAAPADLDVKYTPAGLAAAFRQLCKNIGCEIEQLGVDDTEFPYLVYGVVKGDGFFEGMKSGLNALPGYAYSGSTTGRTREGTYFSLNMMPSKSYPRELAEPIRRRLMIRLQMLSAAWQPVR